MKMTTNEYIDRFNQLYVLGDLAYKHNDEKAINDITEEIDRLKKQMWNDINDLDYMDVCWTMAHLLEEED